MESSTLQALISFPDRLEEFYAAVPADHAGWAPESWNGIPSESFTAIGQICHVRDIEIDGYHRRLQRTLAEHEPFLANIDGYRLERERDYAHADAGEVLASFRAARMQTVELIRGLDATELDRHAVFEDYGAITLRGLVHLLCSHDQQHLAGLQWLLGMIEARRANGETS
ncbi:DinB family protein [Rudaea sp.]|uniref:DinB family protein n=1 Tax=Rudaea sp. TaxID=2136325 RepID=UPI002ED3A9B5